MADATMRTAIDGSVGLHSSTSGSGLVVRCVHLCERVWFDNYEVEAKLNDARRDAAATDAVKRTAPRLVRRVAATLRN